MSVPSRQAVLLVGASLAACSGSGSGISRRPTRTGDTALAASFVGRTYERDFVFTAPVSDSTFLVPWLMSIRTHPGSVERDTRGFLVRGGTWNEFYSARWETPPSRAPWRILPHESLRIVVGEGDVIEDLLFEEGSRSLDLEMDDVLQEWTGPRGETFQVRKGAAYLSGRKVEGLVLNVFRARSADEPEPGDWAFLFSGDSLQVVLEAPKTAPPGAAGAYRGWARLDFRNLEWPDVTVDWTEVRAFEPSRQDVPVAWTISSDDDDVSGTLEVRTAQISPGRGTGPVLPVDALFQVTGKLIIKGGTYPVRGLFRHRRP